MMIRFGQLRNIKGRIKCEGEGVMERKLSIVIPAYNEEESLEELYKKIVENIHICMNVGLISDYELLFVDDGSTDSSVSRIRAIRKNDKRVHLIIFRKSSNSAGGF